MRKLKSRMKLAANILRYGHLPTNSQMDLRPLTSEEITEIKEFFPMPKFFIFGHARSGTTLLARLIRLHPEVHCNWQAHFFTRPPLLRSLVSDANVAEWLKRKSNRWNRGADLSTLVMRATSDFILERDARQVGKTVVGDKSPNSLLNGQAVRELHAVYPDAKLIFIVRDGRDVLISHRFQQFIDKAEHLSKQDLAIREEYENDPKSFLQSNRSIFTPKGFSLAAKGWQENVRETDLLARELFANQYLCIRFEELLSKPIEQISALWNFLEVNSADLADSVTAEMSSNPDADWQQEKAGGLVAQLEKGKRGSWQELFALQDRQTFKKTAGEMLITLKYEKDLNW